MATMDYILTNPPDVYCQDPGESEGHCCNSCSSEVVLNKYRNRERADRRRKRTNRKSKGVVEEVVSEDELVSESDESDYSDADKNPWHVSSLVKGDNRLVRTSYIHTVTFEGGLKTTVEDIQLGGKAHYLCFFSARELHMLRSEPGWRGELHISKPQMETTWRSFCRETCRKEFIDHHLDPEIEDPLFLGPFREFLGGNVKLGEVVGKNAANDTYTRQATYCHKGYMSSWECTIDVPKATVESWTLADWEGQKDYPQSIEKISDAQKAFEEMQSHTYSVRFTKFIKEDDDGMQQMLVDMRNAQGEKVASKRPAHVKVKEIDPPAFNADEVHLTLQVDMKYGEPCHLNGTINRNLRQGRFRVEKHLHTADIAARKYKRYGKMPIRPQWGFPGLLYQLPVNARPTQVRPDPVGESRRGSTFPDLSKLQASQQETDPGKLPWYPKYGFRGVIDPSQRGLTCPNTSNPAAPQQTGQPAMRAEHLVYGFKGVSNPAPEAQRDPTFPDMSNLTDSQQATEPENVQGAHNMCPMEADE